MFLLGSFAQSRINLLEVLILVFVTLLMIHKIVGSYPQDFIALPLLCWLVILRKGHYFELRLRGYVAFGLALYFAATMVAFGFMTDLSRYAALSGDPNHTAALYITPLLFLFITMERPVMRGLFFLACLIIVLITQSRGAALAICLFVLVWSCKGLFNKKAGNYLYIVIYLALIFSQLIFGLFYSDNLASATTDREIFGVIDNSNQGRVLISMEAAALISESVRSFLFGIENYRQAIGSLEIDIHHGALQLAMRYGVLMVLIFHLYILKYALSRGNAHMAFLITVVALSSILSPAVLYFPTLLLLFIPSRKRFPEAGNAIGTGGLPRDASDSAGAGFDEISPEPQYGKPSATRWGNGAL
jgi:hypothetical protein